MFSSATPGLGAGERLAQRRFHRAHRRLDRQRHRLRCRAPSASARASSMLPRLEKGDGISTPSTLARRRAPPRPSAAVSAESMPPDSPSTDGREAALARRSRACRARARARFPIRRRRRPAARSPSAASRSQTTTSAAKERAARDRRAVAPERAAAAVEDEVVVAAELIHVDDRHAVFARHAAEHLARAADACRPRTAMRTD